MLQYAGKALVFDGNGNPVPHDGYDVRANVLEVVGTRIRFSEEKCFSNGSVVPGEFEFDLLGKHCEYAEKGISLTYISPNECVGTVSIQGKPFSLASYFSFSRMRNVVFNAERTYVETLSPVVSDVSFLSQDETAVIGFVREKALEFLDVRSIILFGSRAQRSHLHGSDFDFAIDAAGQKRDWLALADCCLEGSQCGGIAEGRRLRRSSRFSQGSLLVAHY